MTTKVSSATAKKKLAELIKRCIEEGFRDELIAAAGGEDEAHALAWDVVANDIRYVGDVELSQFLLERVPSEHGAATLAAHLARHQPPDDRPQYLPRWYPDVDTLVFRALAVAPAAFAAAEAMYPDWAKLGLAFVRWRRGETIPSDQATRIATELARTSAHGKLPQWTVGEPMRMLDEQRTEVPLVLQTTADVRRLAQAIASDGGQRFDEALALAVRENAWETIASVAPVLRAMPRGELLAQLAGRWSPRRALTRPGVYWLPGAETYRMDEALALFEVRLANGVDTPSELFADARRLALAGARDDSGRGDPRLLAMVLAISAAQRADGSDDVLAELEALVSFAGLIEYPPLLRALAAALRTLPAPPVHAWVEATIDSDGAAVAALAAHFDEVLLATVLTGATPIVVEALAVLGPRALPTLMTAMNALPVERAVPVRHAFVFALAAATIEGSEPPEALDLELLVAAFDGCPMERKAYGPDLRAATESIVNAMPRERREALLTAAYEAAPMSMIAMLPAIADDAELNAYLGTAIVDGMVTDWILSLLGARAVPALLACGGQSKRAAWVREQAEQGLPRAEFAKVAKVFIGGEMWRLIEQDVAAANARHPAAHRIRVYLLAKAGLATPAREGSRSRLGGDAHGLPSTSVPKDDAGEDLMHVLTLDLDDVPELRARYPRASAIALFSPPFEDGGRAEDSVLVPLPGAKVHGRTREGHALAVFGIDIPREVFDDPDRLEPALRAVRNRVSHAGGHVFGRPFWIHDKPFSGDDGEGFVMQINDGLHEQLNLGDGALYVYDDDVVIAQAL